MLFVCYQSTSTMILIAVILFFFVTFCECVLLTMDDWQNVIVAFLLKIVLLGWK